MSQTGIISIRTTQKNVMLKLRHKEYEQEAKNQNKMPYAYRTYCEKYGHYGKKCKLTMPIHRKPAEILEVDWQALNPLLSFLEENMKKEERLTAEFMIQNFLRSLKREHYYQGIDIYTLANRSFRFMEKYSLAIIQVEDNRNDATLIIYHGDEET